jgi:histidinol-phosphate aminotransferase
MSLAADVRPGLVRAALDELVPYEPGKPVEEVQRELGLERIVKLASNEGPFGPFPAALEVLARGIADLNRYPDGGCYRLRAKLAELHDVRFEEVTVCAGADAVIGYLCHTTLEPGDEIVTGWPSFVSFVLDPLKFGATPVRVPTQDHGFDLDAMLEAVTPRTKLAFIATPNNPTGTMTTRSELDRWFENVPEHVLTVVDQAYFEYVDDPGYPDAILEYARAGRQVMVLRTFSKIYGLAALRVGYGVGPAPVITAIGKVRRAFDVASPAQEAALVSLDDHAEVARRRTVNRESMSALDEALHSGGLEPVPGAGNFLFVETGGDARVLYEALLRRGVIVRPMGPFGAPGAIRVTAGTLDEIEFLREQLAAIAPARAT